MKTALQVAVFKALHRGAAALKFGVATYRPPERRDDFAYVRRVKAGRDMLMTPLEAMQLIQAVRATSKRGGCMAEVGVYQGASAKLIRQADDRRLLHLFDTFAGLPAVGEHDTEFRTGAFEEGQFACSLESVRAYLGDRPDIVYHQGLFPDSASAVAHERFSFVHLDVDLYESSHNSVTWFYERLVPGGILLSHDFVT